MYFFRTHLKNGFRAEREDFAGRPPQTDREWIFGMGSATRVRFWNFATIFLAIALFSLLGASRAIAQSGPPTELPEPPECTPGFEGSCQFSSEGCQGLKVCKPDGTWGACQDVSGDGCPADEGDDEDSGGGSSDGETDSAPPIVHCGNIGQTPCTLCDLYVLAKKVINFLLFQLALPIAVIILLIGGVILLTAAGSPEKIKLGKAAIYNTVVGILIAFAAWLLINTLLLTLGFGVPFATGIKPWTEFPTCQAPVGGGPGSTLDEGFCVNSDGTTGCNKVSCALCYEEKLGCSGIPSGCGVKHYCIEEDGSTDCLDTNPGVCEARRGQPTTERPDSCPLERGYCPLGSGNTTCVLDDCSKCADPSLCVETPIGCQANTGYCTGSTDPQIQQCSLVNCNECARTQGECSNVKPPICGGGTCPIQSSGLCSISNLQSSFGPAAGEASQICFAESGGDRSSPSGTDKTGSPCPPGISTPDPNHCAYSWGLFQINIRANTIAGLNCPNAFIKEGGTWKIKNTPDAQALFVQCVRAAQNASINIAKAVELYRLKGWAPWGARTKCGL